MGHSTLCKDETTYYSLSSGKCEPCNKPDAGSGITPNCGYDDDGGRHERSSKKCEKHTFNDGQSYYCQPCSTCVGEQILQQCTEKVDTICTAERPSTTVSVVSGETTRITTTTRTFAGVTPLPAESWALPLTVICFIVLVLLCLFIYTKKGYRRSPRANAQFIPLTAVRERTQVKDIISPDVLASPLTYVLDDLDVLEELIILLDPEPQGIKNTKHLASLCNFPFSWVTYTYSLKESKSPLKAVLEGVTCRHPEWTVGHLAELLRQMERMDAVMVLGKIRNDKVVMIDV